MDGSILASIKQKQQATWASGDFAVIGTTLQIVGETLAEAADVRSGERVIDIAAGNGNATLAAARRFAQVTSTDYVPHLLEKASNRARAENLPVAFQVADAEALPFADELFDVALSTFGVMFAPAHGRAAAEMVRVVRRGGRIGLANWTPAGFIGQLFKTVSWHMPPPPAGLQSPMLWGDEAHLVNLFGERVSAIRAEKRIFNFRYKSAAHFIEMFREYYGPTHKAFASLGVKEQAALESDLMKLLQAKDVGGGKGLVVPGEYLEAVITR